MSSAAQLMANQQNSQKSTGPNTDAGKQKAALNSTRHGFTGQVVMLTAEEAEPYRLFNEQFLADLAPQGAVEQQLSRAIIDSHWQLNQIHATESVIYALGHREYLSQFADETPEIAAAMARALTFENKRRELDRLHRYAARLQRQVARDFDLFRHLQHNRNLREEKQKERAMVLYRGMKKLGKTWDPAEFGFVWSAGEIEAMDRLESAFYQAQRTVYTRIEC